MPCTRNSWWRDNQHLRGPGHMATCDTSKAWIQGMLAGWYSIKPMLSTPIYICIYIYIYVSILYIMVYVYTLYMSVVTLYNYVFWFLITFQHISWLPWNKIVLVQSHRPGLLDQSRSTLDRMKSAHSARGFRENLAAKDGDLTSSTMKKYVIYMGFMVMGLS